jgi:hypothetical protein
MNGHKADLSECSIRKSALSAAKVLLTAAPFRVAHPPPTTTTTTAAAAARRPRGSDLRALVVLWLV